MLDRHSSMLLIGPFVSTLMCPMCCPFQITRDIWRAPFTCGLVFLRIKTKIHIGIERRCVSGLAFGHKTSVYNNHSLFSNENHLILSCY